MYSDLQFRNGVTSWYFENTVRQALGPQHLAMGGWEPLIYVWRYIWALRLAMFCKPPRFNFLTIHYFWIIGLAILGSILLYPAGNLAYIDALFFASGACTQSGLNSVDINLLSTYQQLVLFFLPMLTNPITINTFIVFIRLYWFEKRFQHIVREALRNRRTISQSRSQANCERDVGKEEQGVNGRKIVVLHPAAQASRIPDHLKRANSDTTLEKLDTAVQRLAGNISENSEGRKESGMPAKEEKRKVDGPSNNQPQIKFAERVKRSDGQNESLLQLPPKRDDLAVIERQRNPQDTGVLRIPGPRDSEMGMDPETIDEDEATRRIDSRRCSGFYSRYGSQPGSPRWVSDSNGCQVSNDQPQTQVEDSAQAAAHTLRPRRLENHNDCITNDEDNRLVVSRSKPKSVSSANTNLWTPYLSWQPTVGRNSAFVNLLESQREELGGIEYRSLKSLALILLLYFWGFTIMGIVGLLPWVYAANNYGSIVGADGQNRTWWAFFTASSSFNDVGFTLTPDSMISFQAATWPLLFMSFLIIVGNTGFPVMLRWIIWTISKLVPVGSGIWEELRFLLDHPRRCFTLLFPSKATWWLFWILVILNGVDLILFIILDLGNTIVTQLPVNMRILDGWFQAVSTRTAGFACVNLSALHPAIQVSYLVMMYISVLPIAISVRRTNVYEEKSLGLYGSPAEEEEDDSEPSYVGAHLRRQLSFDLWYIFLGLFIISASEGPRIQSGDPNFTMFTVLFEVVSAYGTVGLSLGYAGINASFSAEFGAIAKLVIIAMQIRGRHRGLPYELDRAILLPSESLHKAEDHDAAARSRRRSSVALIPETRAFVGNERRNNERRKSPDKENGPNILSSTCMLQLRPTVQKSDRQPHKDGPPTKRQGDVSQLKPSSQIQDEENVIFMKPRKSLTI